MYIESVQLKNFRNYDSLEVNFDQGTNIFYGDNAQGKTNILESLYLCGTTKSHKGSKDKEVIRFGEEDAHIRMMVKRNELSYKIDMHLRKNKDRFPVFCHQHQMVLQQETAVPVRIVILSSLFLIHRDPSCSNDCPKN